MLPRIPLIYDVRPFSGIAQEENLAGLPTPPLAPKFVLHRDPSPVPFLLFTGKATPVNPDRWVLSAGSLWIAAEALARDGRSGDYAGLRIASGEVQTSVPAVVVADGARIAAGTSILIQVQPSQPADSTFGSPPANATFAFAPAGHAKIGADKATIDPGSGTTTLKSSKQEAAFDPRVGRVIVPFDPDANGTILNLGGPAATVSGSCTFTGAGWALPVRTFNVANPVYDAGSGGAPALICAEGLIASWPGLANPVELGSVYILGNDGERQIVATGSSVRRVPFSTPGWTDFDPGDPGITLVQLFEFLTENTSFTGYVETSSGKKSLRVFGTLRTGFAGLRNAGGSRFEVRSPAILEIVQASAGNTITITTVPPDESRAGKTALALSNALLTVTNSPALKLAGEPDEDGGIPTGQVDLTFGIYQLLPILPDPYAANFDCVSGQVRYKLIGNLKAIIVWQESGPPDMKLSILPPTSADLPQAYVPEPIEGSPDNPDSVLWRMFEDFLGGIPHDSRRLLDVSGNGDQLGISLGMKGGANPGDGPFTIGDSVLETFGYNVHIFALPQVAWEPVNNIINLDVSPFPDKAISVTDGDRAQIGVNTVHLVPVSPAGAAGQLVAAYQHGAKAAAVFTLPFGIEAVAELGPSHFGEWLTRPSLRLERPAFAEHVGARHFRLQAGTRIAGGGLQGRIGSFLPGAALQTNNIVKDGELNLATPTSVLGVIEGFFNSAFGPGGYAQQVPLSRVDLSGYGENTVSDWVDETSSPPKVSQVSFDVLNGRTKREVVQVTSYLWPCQAIVVRTIVMERSGSANVMRYDSGWVATTPGLFTGSKSNARFHTGAVHGMYNIREIRDTTQIVKVAGEDVQAVYFDADVAIDNVVQGQNPEKRVPARNQLGYVQLLSVKPEPDGVKPPAPLSAAALTDLLTNHGPVGGAMDCVIDIGGSGLKERVFGLYSEPAGGLDFAVVLYGMPIFAGGPWSIAHISHGKFEGEVKAVDPHLGVPLIRENGGPAFRFADGADLLSAAAPANDYALLYTGHTHRVLFPRPFVKPGQRAIFGEVPGMLADPYAMLSATGIFPVTGAALKFNDPGYVLDVTAAGLKTRNQMLVAPAPERRLADTSSWALRVTDAASDIHVNIDPSAAVTSYPNTWPVQMTKVSTVLDVPPFNQMFTIQNDTPDLGPLKPQLPNPVVILGPDFQEFNKIASALQDMNLPAGLDFSLAGSGLENQTYHLRFNGKLRLATKEGDRVDLGIGKVSGELGVGGDIAANLTAAPQGRIWFDVGGDLQQAIIPKILYAGGLLKFHIAIDENGQADWQLDAGTVASIGGDVLGGIVALEATVHYAYLLTPSLKPAVRLGMDARAELADGLVGVKFGVDASVSISRPGPEIDKVRIEGDVMAMGQITVAWVFDPEFSRRLHFKQDIELRYVAFAAYAGLLPVPV